jgi:PBSX family phage portal protein
LSKEQQHVLTKAITIQADQRRSVGGSKQLPPDPFAKLYAERGLVRPPYRLERLLEIKESNAIHGACIEQKSADIAGLGWHWVPRRGIDKPPDKQRDELDAFLESCNPEMTFRELLQVAWDDYETLAWCAFEVVPDRKGRPALLYHIPGHTLRAHNDGVRFAQIRDEKLRWFKRFGTEQNFDLESGEPRDGGDLNRLAGEIIVVRKGNSRSSYYGIPQYIGALGAIVGGLAARDFNIGWFSERTIPDAMLIIEGADVSQAVQDELRAFFNVEGKGRHGKLCILPIPSSMAGEVRARLEKLMPEVRDASFRLYRQDNALEICVAHRVPPYRIGWPIVGSLGGTTAKEMTEIYKRSVIQPGQEILEHRLNNQLFRRLYAKGQLQWRWKLDEIDLSDQMLDLDYSIRAVERGIFTANEARKHLGHDPYPGGNVFYMPNMLQPVAEDADDEVSKRTGATFGTVRKRLPPIEAEESGSSDQAWDDFAALHSPLEKELREQVVRFFGPRQRGH